MLPVSRPRSGSKSLDWQVWPVTMKTGRLDSLTLLSDLGAAHAAFQQARRSLSRPAAIDALRIVYKMVFALHQKNLANAYLTHTMNGGCAAALDMRSVFRLYCWQGGRLWPPRQSILLALFYAALWTLHKIWDATEYAETMTFISSAHKHGVAYFDAVKIALQGNALALVQTWG